MRPASALRLQAFRQNEVAEQAARDEIFWLSTNAKMTAISLLLDGDPIQAMTITRTPKPSGSYDPNTSEKARFVFGRLVTLMVLRNPRLQLESSDLECSSVPRVNQAVTQVRTEGITNWTNQLGGLISLLVE
jgi:hypothetical protein